MSQSVIVKNKEIRVKNPQMVIEDENRAELIEFTITNANSIEGVDGMNFYVQFKNKLGEVGMDTLVNPLGEVHNDMLVLDWLPSASFTKERGKVDIQIIGFTESLVVSADTTYKSGKMYFSDSTGTFLPVYPSTSEHTPKVGETILGTVYENQITGDDHRWSTEKCTLTLPENIYDNGTPVYTEEQVKNLITQLNEQVLLAETYSESAEDSASDAEESALKAEGFAVGEQNGAEVSSSSPYYENNAKFYSESARDSADDASTSATNAQTSEDNAEQYAEDADNARIVSVSETQSPDDGGTNVVVITYKDGTTFTFFVKNGHTGTPFTIYKTYSSIAEMNADFANVPEGRFVIISSSVSDPDNSKMYVRGADAFTFVTDLSGAQGIQGPTGQAATITVGTVSTGAAGSSASIVNSGTSSAAVFDFIIPKGDKGEQGIQGEQGIPGPTPVITIGSVTYGDTPTVTIDTTDPAHPVMNFVLKTSEVGVVDNLNSSSSVDALSARQGSVLKNSIQAINARVENLEEKAGDYTEVDVKSVYSVPTGKASNMVLVGLEGRSRVKNNLFPTRTLSYTSKGLTVTSNNDGTISISGTTNATGVFDLVSDIGSTYNGKSYLIGLGLNIVSGSAPSALTYGFKYGDSMGSGFFYGDSVATAFATVLNSQDFMMNIYATNVSVNITLTPIITDLNVYFNTTDLSFLGATDSAKLATIQTNYPWLLTPSDYDAGSLVSTEYSGMESKSPNIWDEEWELGDLNSNNGADYPDNNRIRSKNKNPIVGDIAYYLKCSANALFCFYDENENFVRGTSVSANSSFTPPADARYFRFSLATSYGTTYNHDVQIADNSLPDAIKTTYHPYMTDTLTFPSPISLKSAGSVAEEAYLNEDGQAWKTNPIASHTFDGTETWVGWATGVSFWQITSDYFKKASSNGVAVDYLISDAGLEINPANSISSNGGMGVSTGGAFLVADADRSKLTGKTLYYALATPDADTPLTVLIDNLIPTEGGGTLEAVKTYPIDDSFTVGYLTL